MKLAWQYFRQTKGTLKISICNFAWNSQKKKKNPCNDINQCYKNINHHFKIHNDGMYLVFWCMSKAGHCYNFNMFFTDGFIAVLWHLAVPVDEFILYLHLVGFFHGCVIECTCLQCLCMTLTLNTISSFSVTATPHAPTPHPAPRCFAQLGYPMRFVFWGFKVGWLVGLNAVLGYPCSPTVGRNRCTQGTPHLSDLVMFWF